MSLNRVSVSYDFGKQYKCPYCGHEIIITKADFINGIAVASCAYCGNEAFTIQENEFSIQPLQAA